MFFPRAAIKEMFAGEAGENMIQKILECSCTQCKQQMKNLRRRPAEYNELIHAIVRNRQVFFAILIYLESAHLVKFFSDGVPEITDDNLEVNTWLSNYPNQAAELPKGFAGSFMLAREHFRPPKFVIGEHTRRTRRYGDQCRFPYIRDSSLPYAYGSFGVVEKFTIHPDYVDPSVIKLIEKTMLDNKAHSSQPVSVSPDFEPWHSLLFLLTLLIASICPEDH